MRSAQPGSLSCCCSLTLLLADYAAGLERNSQLCIYKDGKPVVDLWGENHAFSTAPESGYDGDTLQIVYSSTKALAAAVFALAADQGLFKYDDTVASIWPEFAQNGGTREELPHVALCARVTFLLASHSSTLPTGTTAKASAAAVVVCIALYLMLSTSRLVQSRLP